MKKKICIVLCLGCIGTVSVVGCSNKNFDSKVTGDNQTTTENVSDILNDQEKKEGGYENESSSHADDKRELSGRFRSVGKCRFAWSCFGIFRHRM